MSTRLKVALAVCVMVGVGVFALRPRPGPRITRIAYEQIEIGMTQTQVQVLLGGPPGDYGARDMYSYDQIGSAGGLPEVGRVERWLGTCAFVSVEFDDQGRVAAKELLE